MEVQVWVFLLQEKGLLWNKQDKHNTLVMQTSLSTIFASIPMLVKIYFQIIVHGKHYFGDFLLWGVSNNSLFHIQCLYGSNFSQKTCQTWLETIFSAPQMAKK